MIQMFKVRPTAKGGNMINGSCCNARQGGEGARGDCMCRVCSSVELTSWVNVTDCPFSPGGTGSPLPFLCHLPSVCLALQHHSSSKLKA